MLAKQTRLPSCPSCIHSPVQAPSSERHDASPTTFYHPLANVACVISSSCSPSSSNILHAHVRAAQCCSKLQFSHLTTRNPARQPMHPFTFNKRPLTIISKHQTTPQAAVLKLAGHCQTGQALLTGTLTSNQDSFPPCFS